MKADTLYIRGDAEDIIVEITKRVAVPRASIMESTDPARALIDVMQANLRTALDKDGYAEAKEQLAVLSTNAADDITNRINAERGSLSRGEVKELTDRDTLGKVVDQ